jgi:hypothetical protein
MKLERIVVMSLILVIVLRNISVNYLLPEQYDVEMFVHRV